MKKKEKKEIIDSIIKDIFEHRLILGLSLPFKTGLELKENFLSNLPYPIVIQILREAADKWNETEGQRLGVLVDWNAFKGCWDYFGIDPKERRQDFADLIYIGANRVCGYNARSVKNYNLTSPLVNWKKGKEIIFDGIETIDPTKGILEEIHSPKLNDNGNSI